MYIIFILVLSLKYYVIPGGLMARIAGFHPAGPGSIPGVEELIFFFLKSNQEKKK